MGGFLPGQGEVRGLRTEAQLCYMSMLLGRPFSEPLAEHEVSSWSLSMVTSLLSLLDTLLLGEGVGGEDCGEPQLLAWVALLLNTHYLQVNVNLGFLTLTLC